MSAAVSSPDVLFDAPSDSPEPPFSTPRAELAKIEPFEPESSTVALHTDVDDNTETPDSDEQKLDGLRTVNLTPTHEHDTNDIVSKSSPPLVLKSAPGTPTTLNHIEQELSFDLPNHQPRDDDDDDPRELVISSLRTQISDMYTQLSDLNSKLVQSYDRMSALEDQLDDSRQVMTTLESKSKNLENEREEQVNMIKNGTLVERAAVAAELTRLMEEAVAERKARETEEIKRRQIEKELGDLSDSLFSQANEMVAEERKARARAEERIGVVEGQLDAKDQTLNETVRKLEIVSSEKEIELRELNDLKHVVQSIDRRNLGIERQTKGGSIRVMNSHTPYKTEYLGFLQHLRSLASSSFTAPPVATFLPQPFLARLINEDSEPTLRLDLAPSLNWLSRRSVISAIHHNQLKIEEIHVASLFLESSSSSSFSYASFTSSSGSSLPTSPTQLTKVSCSLCGKTVYVSPEAHQQQLQKQQQQSLAALTSALQSGSSGSNTATHPEERIRTNSTGWSTPKFWKAVGGTPGTGVSPKSSVDFGQSAVQIGAPSVDRPISPPPPTSLQTVIHAFRVPSQRPNETSQSSLGTPTYGQAYPLCPSGWCLGRLRTTCELWAFINNDIIQRVWDDTPRHTTSFGGGEPVDLPSGITTDRRGSAAGIYNTAAGNGSPTALGSTDSPPPVPPRRKMASYWGMSSTSPVTASPSQPAPSGSNESRMGGLWNGVKRSLSGSAAPTAPSTPLTRSPRSSLDLTNTANALFDSTRAPPLPPRRTAHHNPTGSAASITATQAQPSTIDEVPLKSQSDEPPAHTGNSATNSSVAEPISGLTEAKPAEAVPIPEAPSISSENFVTPSTTLSEVPITIEKPTDSQRSVTPDADKTATAESLSAATQHLTPEPSTPTPAATTFDKMNTHRRVISASGSATGLEEDKRPGSAGSPLSSPSKSGFPAGAGGTGSRPTTPGKAPPLPRRAAARNAARGSMILVKPAEEKKEDGAEKEKEKPQEVNASAVTATAGAPSEPPAAPATSTTDSAVVAETVVNSSSQPKPSDALTLADANASLSTALPPPPVPAATAGDKEELPSPATPKSVHALPPPHSDSSEPIPPIPHIDTGGSDSKKVRPRQASVASTSSASVYTPSVYTNNSGIGATPGVDDNDKTAVPFDIKGGSAEDGQGGPELKMYVGHATWEERAWLKLVKIRERMFWARIGGVTY